MHILTKDTNNYPQTEHEVVERGYVPHIHHRGEENKTTISCKRMGCYRKNKFMAQQFQKTTGKIREESGELPWTSTSVMLHNCIPEDNFGIGSKY
jgi:hypothetical protein